MHKELPMQQWMGGHVEELRETSCNDGILVVVSLLHGATQMEENPVNVFPHRHVRVS